MTEAADRFDPKRLGRVAYEVAKRHFPQDKALYSRIRSSYFPWDSTASRLRDYPVERQESFFQAFFDRKSIQMPNGLRLARFLVTLNNPKQPLSLRPDQTTDPYQLVREYFQNIGHPPMKAVQVVQRLSEVEGEDMREVVDMTLGSTKRQLYETTNAQAYTEALTFVLDLTRVVANSSIYREDIESQRFMRRYAAICGGAIMVQALASDRQDPSFAIEPLIQLHERGYLMLGPVLTVAKQQPRWRRFLPVGPARESTFTLYRPQRTK